MATSNFALENASGFKVEELFIVKKDGRTVDITAIYQEINIYDSLFSPVMSGNILISDSVTLFPIAKFDGAEAICIKIKKTDKSEFANFKKSFRIYNHGFRYNKGLNNEQYVLHFVSDEFIFSEQQKVSEAYEDTYSNIYDKILKKYIKPPKWKEGMWEPSVGIRKVVIPNLRPLEALEWCARRATDTDLTPEYVFYESMTGFNLNKLSTLHILPAVCDVKLEMKNRQKPEEEMYAGRSHEVLGYQDYFDRTRQGVYAGKFLGFDPVTRTYLTKKIEYKDHYDTMKHANKYPNLTLIRNRNNKKNIEEFDSRKALYAYKSSQLRSRYIRRHDPASLSKLENYEDWLFHRRAIFKNLTSKKLKFTMPGNFQLTSGLSVNAIIPEWDRKQKNDDNLDDSLIGKYLIIGTRHIIGLESHETVIEVVSSSNEIPVQQDHPKQLQALLNYGIKGDKEK